MSPYRKRRLIDLAVHCAAAGMAIFANWKAALVAAALSMWSFYDGLTRRDLRR